MKPKYYIKFRMVPMMQFCEHPRAPIIHAPLWSALLNTWCSFSIDADKKRLPEYERWRFTLNLVLVLAGAASVLVAHAGEAAWVSVISAVTTAVFSWTEFCGFQRKLARHTGTLDPSRSVS